MTTKTKLPDYLAKYQRSPEEILGDKVLPPQSTKKRTMRGFGGGAGAMPKYASAEALQYAVDLYFEKMETQGRPVTIPGLVLALGFSAKGSLMNYKKRGEDYEFVIDQAFTRIEEPANVQLLRGGNATQGTIFLLKNHHHYADKVEQTHVHEAGDSLTQLVQSLQGRVLRPQLQQQEPEVIEDAEYTEMDMDDLI